MRPHIDGTTFGSITIDGVDLDRDVIIRLDGRVQKRKKMLSKAIYGTSHVISREEAEYVYQEGAKRLIVGSGQFGLVELSDEAAGFFQDRGCQVDILPTKEAIQAWNEAGDGIIGLFHVTC
ncbi:MAG: Mth938-like domain-containing protein [Anaerolineae bacterium]